MPKDEKEGLLFPVIEHAVEAEIIDQRTTDGYINATAICRACGKQIGHYFELKSTKEFLKELEVDIGIPMSTLIQIYQGYPSNLQGTWVHPQVAINLGQWASPKFAVLVSKWVYEWMGGKQKAEYQLPYHIRRYLINRSKIPPSHFSILDEMTLKLVAPLEHYGYTLPTNLMPDISMGKMFCKWCRDHGHDPDDFPTYEHEFDDGKRAPVQARLYPNELLAAFRAFVNDVWIKDRSIEYFQDRDPNMVPLLKMIIAELPAPVEKQQIEQF